MKEVTGIVLAGGKSSRMSCFPKGLLLYKDKLVIEHIIENISPLCQSVIISANTDYYTFLGYRVVKDNVLHQGPLEGIISGMKNSATEANIVAPCDTPFVSSYLFRCLLLQPSFNYDAVIPIYNNQIHPLCGIYYKKALNKLEGLREEGILKMKLVLADLNVRYVHIKKDLSFYNAHLFMNINSEPDFRELKKISL